MSFSERFPYSHATQTLVKRPRGFQLPVNPFPPSRSISNQTNGDFDCPNALSKRLPNVAASLASNGLPCRFLIQVESDPRVVDHEAKTSHSAKVFSVKGQEYRAGRRVSSSLAPVRGQQLGKSTRLNSSHLVISYAVFCLKKKTITRMPISTRRQTVSPIGCPLSI